MRGPLAEIPEQVDETGAPASLGSRVRSGALWSAASTLLLRFANVAITVVVVRLVTPQQFGVFAIAITVYTVVTSMSELGVLSIVTRGDTDLDALGPTVTTVALLGNLAVAGAMFAFAAPIASALGESSAAGPLRVLSLVVVLYGIFAVPGAVLTREFRQDRIFYANVIAFVPANGLLIVLAHSGDGAMAFAWSRVVGQAVVGICTLLWVSKRFRPGWAREHIRFVMGVGLPMAGANLVGYVLLNADYLFVGKQLGAVRLGIYMLAFNVANWSTSVLGKIVNNVGMPAFSRVKSNVDDLARAALNAHRAVGVIAWPICAITAVSAYPLIETLYGRTWLAAAPVLVILAPYGLIFIHSLVFSNLLIGGAGHARVFLLVQLLWLVTLVPAMAVGVKLADLNGVALAHVVIASVVVMPAYLVAAHRLTGIRSRGLGQTLLPIAIAAAIAGLVDAGLASLVGSPALKLLLGAFGGGLAYLLAIGEDLSVLIPARNDDGSGGGLKTRAHSLIRLVGRPRAAVVGRVWRAGAEPSDARAAKHVAPDGRHRRYTGAAASEGAGAKL